MDFSSDTSAPAHPAVLSALAEANSGTAASYGEDALCEKLRLLLARALETENFDFWICASGTAANALALSLICSATGAILCHEEAHIERDERGAPEFFTGGGKLRLLPGSRGKISRRALIEALAQNNPAFVHETPIEALSMTNLTECGTAYDVAKIEDYAARAKASGLAVHLDGARLANALISTGASPAEMSWKAGIDILTLGLTKTGAMGCEIIILFGQMRRHFASLRARAKRSGHMPPKMRFLAAQALALLQADLWLQLAQRANQQAGRLANTLCAHPDVRLAYPTDGNEVFAVLPDNLRTRFLEAGIKFYPWPGGSWRFVCSWATPDESIRSLSGLITG